MIETEMEFVSGFSLFCRLRRKDAEDHKAVRPTSGTCPHAGRKMCLVLGEKNGVCLCLRDNLEKMLRYWTFRDVINPNPGLEHKGCD